MEKGRSRDHSPGGRTSGPIHRIIVITTIIVLLMTIIVIISIVFLIEVGKVHVKVWVGAWSPVRRWRLPEAALWAMSMGLAKTSALKSLRC